MNFSPLTKQFIKAVSLLWLLGITTLAQGVTGTAAGKVTDAKNKGIHGALVTIANPKRALKGKATTQPNGYFAIPQLPPGPYLLSVEKEGFKSFQKQPVFIDAMGRVNASPVRIEGRTGQQGQVSLAGTQLQIILVSVDEGALNEPATAATALRQLGNFAINGAEGLNVTSRPKMNSLSLGDFSVQVAQNPASPNTQNPATAPPSLPPAKAPMQQPVTAPAQQLQPNGPVPDAGRQQLQSLSGERSELVTNNQVKNLALNGRDILDFLKLIPGIVTSRGEVSANGYLSDPVKFSQFSINGTRRNQHEFVIDGVTNLDTKDNGSPHVTLNPDAIAEIKVLTANYQAEYGKAAGGFIQIVTKSGTTDFHGGLRYFHRHEGLNANNYFNNAAGRIGEGDNVPATDPRFGEQRLARPLYRFNTFGYDLGGPVYNPFGEGRYKKVENLFFFVNQEFFRQLAPNLPRALRVPTETERRGDFRDSLNAFGAKGVLITDPNLRAAGLPCTASNLSGCFPNNVIPANRFFQGGRILGLYPTPNQTPTADNLQRNYVSQASTKYPRTETIARLDYHPTDKTAMTGRVIINNDEQALPFGSQEALNLVNTARLNGLETTPPNEPVTFNAQNFASWNLVLPRPGLNFAFTLSHSFSPTVTGEFIVGQSRNRVRIVSEGDRATQGVNGLNFPTLFPNSNPNPGGYLPNLFYGELLNFSNATTRGPENNYFGLPFKSFNDTFNFAFNLSKVWNQHLVKIGVLLLENRREQSALVQNSGTINFSPTSANPYDTGHPFANALLGVFNRYEQVSAAPVGQFRYRNVEGYVQDLWRVNDRLVLDYGLRLSWYQPQYDERLQTSFFNPQLFDRNKQVRLYTPVCVALDANKNCTNRRAIDPAMLVPGFKPTVGNTKDSSFIALIVPGSGDLQNGIAQAGKNYPRSGLDGRGVQWGPRVGFAFDLLGNGSTILRGGAGIFYDRVQGGISADMLRNPPAVVNRTLANGRLDDLSTATELAPRALTVYGLARDSKIPTVYSYSLGLQRDIGFDTVVDVAYVGTLSRHLALARNLNSVPYGAVFRYENQDRTRFANNLVPREEPNLFQYQKDAGQHFSGLRALSANFLRPYPGYGNIPYYEFGGSSNYHALQVSARRRFSQNLTLSLAYTWSKAFATANDDLELTNAFNTREFDYRLAAYDRTHQLTVSYVYSLPKASRWLDDNSLASVLLDGWQISGVTQLSSGQPLDLLNLSLGTGQGLTGSITELARVYLRDNGRLRPGPGDLQVDPYEFILPSLIRSGASQPKPGPRTYLRGPGVNNFDLSLSKRFPVKSEKRYFQLRWEAYNAFNHTQYSGINTGARFDLTTGAQINSLFGQVSSTRSPRVMQGSLRFTF
ncbi:MAG: carboxypeptidase regulatory-like domain-containing protein [Acidobacteria bacterium]|nr:carboxypeptidase regulatory-like domain-containing protein [Acidobacteriota bacterium]